MTQDTSGQRAKPPDYDAARRVLIERAAAFVRPPVESREEWAALNKFVMDLAQNGWTRGDVHALTLDILDDPQLQLTERSRDELLDFLGSLRGDCAPPCIPRFPGDPDDVEELTSLARGKRWLK